VGGELESSLEEGAILERHQKVGSGESNLAFLGKNLLLK